MKETPVIFSGESVRAILDGCKTMTRRVVKPQPAVEAVMCDSYLPALIDGDYRACPYGQPGDRLWVKETWAVARHFDGYKPSEIEPPQDHIAYRSSDTYRSYKWRRSMYMPRWASRINLEVTGVRVERLQDISFDDIFAEGIIGPYDDDTIETARPHFANLWNALNAERGFGWDVNPWVWVVEFKLIEAEE